MLPLPLILASCFSLTGCGNLQTASTTPILGKPLGGAVHGGQGPIVGANIQLFAAGNTGDGSAATPLLTKTVTSDGSGNFSITGSYTCPSASSLIFITTHGGNPGLAPGTNNAAATLMTALGACGSLTSDTYIAINEVTTVASVSALAPFMTSYTSIGSASTDVSALADAFGQVNELVDTSAGLSPGPALASDSTAPVDEIYTIANILAGCVNSAGGTAGDGSICGQLFSYTQPSVGAPVTETVGAALQIAKNPTTNVTSIFNLLSPTGPFQPVLTSAPDAWAVQTKQPQRLPAGMLPSGSNFTLPAANACQSSYDQFYGNEPGVYAYWPLCEAGTPIQIYDYVGQFDLSSASGSFGSGAVAGGAAGPVGDGETAASVPTATYNIQSQGIPLNTNQGTATAWINADAKGYPVTALFFGAVSGSSGVSISVNTNTDLCFYGNWTNSSGTVATIQKCGYVPNTWHRVVLTWSSGTMNLFIDGNAVANGTYTGKLDNKVFYYKLFPGCCDTGKQMTLAKISVSNQAWNTAQVASDFAPSLPMIPASGVYVTSQALGAIHKDVLGYADYGSDLSTPALTSALTSGLKAAGVTAVRYASGYGGITADLANWQAGVACTSTRGVTGPAQNIASANTIDTFIPKVAQPLGLSLGYTVNYSTNPPYCNAGGDPIVNGANLVDYVNTQKHYGIKYWEIGNEMYSGSSETDFHPNPNTGASYVTYEPAFYDAMKSKDPTIKIAVPVGQAIYDYQANFDLPVLAGAKYDAIVWHNYPINDPITDGATLYQDRVASNTRRTRGSLLMLQTELMNVGKSPDSIWITEWDGEMYGNQWSKQTMGAAEPLFVATQLAEYMQAGVQYATWWTQGNLNGCAQLNYDGNGESAYAWWQCGSASLVYTGLVEGVAQIPVGLQAGNLTPAARGIQLLAQSGFVTEGEHMLRTQNDVQNAPWLLSYAATHGSSYAVILINRDRDNAHTVPVKLAGKLLGTSVKQMTYGKDQYDQAYFGNWTVGPVTSTKGSWVNSFQATLPPWSVNVLIFGN